MFWPLKDYRSPPSLQTVLKVRNKVFSPAIYSDVKVEVNDGGGVFCTSIKRVDLRKKGLQLRGLQLFISHGPDYASGSGILQ